MALAEGKMMFPADFLWGTATAAHQVEGNNRNNDWWAWEQGDGHILHGHQSGVACDWWEHAEADLDRAAEMGTNAHRMSVEWSRIEPEPSVFDRAALERYREILQAMVDRGIAPMVTLHHFSNPLWLVEKGDFNSDLVVDYFQRYTVQVVDALGDLVAQWVTFNEPMVYFFLRYLDDAFPAPQQRGMLSGLQAMRQMLRCHAAAYHTIKARYPEAPVGVAKQYVTIEAKPGGNAVDGWWAKRVSRIFNDLWVEALVDGRLRWPLGRGRIDKLANTFDFIGVNYYTRHYVKFPPFNGFVENAWGPDAQVSDENYGEVYPYGLYQAIRRVVPYKKPIYVTENGLPDREDRLRPGFILDHLRQVWHALSWCYPVAGYYHWSLVDNFEWERGWTQRFGLIGMDPETQERWWRPSAKLYQEICQNYGVSSDMVERYAPDLLPVMFPGGAPAADENALEKS